MKNITIVIADDHPMVLKGLEEELNENGYHVIGKAKNGTEALNLIIKLKPQIALLDIEMPYLTGIEVIKSCKYNCSTKFILLSYHKETEFINQAKQLNISGFLLKEDSFSEIEKCIKAVLLNKQYFSSSFGTILEYSNQELKNLKLLTPSELTIIKLIAKENNTTQISEMLFVSPRTVEKHRSNIINKLELKLRDKNLNLFAFNNKNVILNLK
ncbi:MAG: response regulator transcription factor [Flavobacteriaceae bacterium]